MVKNIPDVFLTTYVLYVSLWAPAASKFFPEEFFEHSIRVNAKVNLIGRFPSELLQPLRHLTAWVMDSYGFWV